MKFLQHTMQCLTQQGWDNLKNYTLVFPMQRAGLYAKMYLSEMLSASGYSKPVVLPRMLTIDQLVDDLSQLREVDEIRAVCQLYDIYRSFTGHPLSLDAFFGWGTQLLNDFTAIDMALLNTRSVVSNMAASQELDLTELDPQTRDNLNHLLSLSPANDSVNAFFHELWQQLPDIYERFCKQQAEQGLGTKGQCYRWVIDHFSELLPKLEGRTYVFVGFNYLLPAERTIMQLLHEQQQALFFWDDDFDFPLNKEVYQYVRQNCLAFPNSLTPEPSPKEKTITAIATTSSNAQAQYVATWLQEHHKPGNRSAVVIADEAMLEAVLYALPKEFSEKVNITKGYPLKHTHTYAEVVKYLADTTHDRLPDETTYALVLERLAAHLERPSMPADADKATWQEILQAEAYSQTLLVINRFLALINEGVLVEVKELRTLRNLLRRMLDAVSLPFHGEPIEEIQVIGVLETRLLDFDNLLILGVEEGVVPGTSVDRCFIPFDLRKAYGMQTREEEAHVYAYNFFRLIRRAQNVTLMFSEATGDMNKKTMSRFLMQMLISPRFQVNKLRIAEGTQSAEPTIIVPCKRWADTAKERTISLPDGTQKTLKVLSLSPSALGDYIECPREFYLKHIEHITEANGRSLIFAPNDLGTLFHGAIRHAYETICNGGQPFTQLTPVDPAKVAAYLSPDQWPANSEVALDAGYHELVDNYNLRNEPKIGEELYRKEQHRAENEVVRTMLYNALEDDNKHLRNLRISLLEADRRRLISNPGWDYPVLIGGVIDRLDQMEENGHDYLRVLDYKTGSHDSKKMTTTSLDTLFSDHHAQYVLQTLVYSSVCHEWKQLNPNNLPIMSQLMFVQKLSADRHVKVGNEFVTDFASQMVTEQVVDPQTGDVTTQHTTFAEAFNRHLKQKISEILADTTFEQCPEGKCGSFCPFYTLCGREKTEW